MRLVTSLVSAFATRYDSNWPAQLQKLYSLEILDIASIDIILCWGRTTRMLIRLHRCTG